MQYKLLGKTGILVSELCLGTMTFGGGSGIWKDIGNIQQKIADDMLKISLDAGINFIDTANVYSNGRSEEITGQAIRNLGIPREDIVLATKVLGPMGKSPNARGASRSHIITQCHASLKRLQSDYIDLYQIHGVDPFTPIEETMEALDSLVRAGDVRYVGVSNWAAWQITKALGIAERKNLAMIRSLQAYYTIVGRDIEREIVPMIEEEKLGLLVWSPLAGGFLSGKYHRDGSSAAKDDRRVSFNFPPVNLERGFNVIDAMEMIATSKGCSVAQIAISWLLHQKTVSSVIIGAKNAEQLRKNIAATKVELSEEELKTLDEVSALPNEYPGWMIKRQNAYRYGGDISA